MAVKCTECGAAVQDDSKFCRYCGAKIMQDETVEVKKHEYRFETVNHAKIRKEELKAEKEIAKAKANAEWLEQWRKYNEEDRVNNRLQTIGMILGIILPFSLLIYLITTL